MKILINILILLLLLLATNTLLAQAPERIKLEITQISEVKESYAIGEQVKLQLKAKQSGEQCTDGIEKIKIYCKGLKITEQANWQISTTGLWTKDFMVKALGNKSGILQVTAYRKTDKGAISKTKTFKLKK